VLNRVVFHQDGAILHNARMNFVFLNHLNYVGDLNPLDFFIFIGNFRDNVYLTSPSTQKELKKKGSASMSGKTPKFFTECKSGHY
jgi:hypothetical protein